VSDAGLAARLDAVRERLERAARGAGRSPASVRLLAVAKTRAPGEIREMIRAGVRDIGENRVQEAEAKARELVDTPVVWHLVGHLQGNKARRAVKLFDLIHSVNSVELAERLSRQAGEVGATQRILAQVDLAGEVTKSGIAAGVLLDALERMAVLPHLRLEGLMTLPPFLPDPEQVRPYFRRLHDLGRSACAKGLLAGPEPELSMGMSYDFEVAVEEGATWVRIGTALFGERAAARAVGGKDLAGGA
jgi:hypothetical protein